MKFKLFSKKPMAKNLQTITKTKVNPKIIVGAVGLVILIGISFVGSSLLLPSTGANDNTNDGSKSIPKSNWGYCYRESLSGRATDLGCGYYNDVTGPYLKNYFFCPDSADCCGLITLKNNTNGTYSTYIRSERVARGAAFLNADAVLDANDTDTKLWYTKACAVSTTGPDMCVEFKNNVEVASFPKAWPACACPKINCHCDGSTAKTKNNELNLMKTIQEREGPHGTLQQDGKYAPKLYQNLDGSWSWYICYGFQLSDPMPLDQQPPMPADRFDDATCIQKIKDKVDGIKNQLRTDFKCLGRGNPPMGFDTLPCNIQAAMIEMAYQLGTARLINEYPNFLKDICECKYDDAIKEATGLANPYTVVGFLKATRDCSLPEISR